MLLACERLLRLLPRDGPLLTGVAGIVATVAYLVAVASVGNTARGGNSVRGCPGCLTRKRLCCMRTGCKKKGQIFLTYMHGTHRLIFDSEFRYELYNFRPIGTFYR